MDGGMSNISSIVNTLQTLATESASTSFTGSRTTLNNQFQSDLGEIDRQAQSIGLNVGGTFAANMAVYLGAGSGSQSQANGVVNVNLSNATVDTQSLGLKGVQALTLGATVAADYDLGASSATSVNAIATTAANTASEATPGSTVFDFSGAGYTNLAVTVNMTGVDSTDTLVSAINAGIQAAASTSGAANAAFAANNITASIHTDSLGKEQLAFNSSVGSFQATATDKMSNALMGNLAVAGAPTGALATTAASSIVAGGGYMLGHVVAGVNTEQDLAFATESAANVAQSVTISANDASGNAHTLTIQLTVANTATTAGAVAAINAKLQGSDDTTLQQISALTITGGAAAAGTINFAVSRFHWPPRRMLV
jgi:hypothetical protein